MTLPAQMLNDTFINKLDTDKRSVDSSSLNFVLERLKLLNSDAKDVKVTINQVANLVTIKVVGDLKGTQKTGEKTFTKMELLTTTEPITHFIEELIKNVFEVPLEGTPVS
jgi:hypothetical protein